MSIWTSNSFERSIYRIMDQSIWTRPQADGPYTMVHNSIYGPANLFILAMNSPVGMPWNRFSDIAFAITIAVCKQALKALSQWSIAFAFATSLINGYHHFQWCYSHWIMANFKGKHCDYKHNCSTWMDTESKGSFTESDCVCVHYFSLLAWLNVNSSIEINVSLV